MGHPFRRTLAAIFVIVVVVVVVSGCGATPTGQVSPVTPETSPPPGSSAPASASASASASPATTVKDSESWISFQWLDAEGADGILLVRPDGTGLHQVVDMPGTERHPDWSPDGTRLAFIHAPQAGPDELWVVDADGSDATKLIACDLPCNEFNYPDWADAEGIYYGFDSDATSSTPPTTFGVARYAFDTSTSTVVQTRTDGMTAEQPRISPDGTRVAFDRGPIDGTGMAIYVADLDGGKEQRLTDLESHGAHPDWITDDQLVFNTFDLGFFQDTSAPSNLFLVAADGSSLKALTTYAENGIRATQPRIAPDGVGIVYTQVDRSTGSRTLAYIATDGTGQRSLTPEPISGTHPQLRPLP